MSNHISIAGCRVFITEDEPFIAVMLEDFLIECGCEIIGPINNFTDSLFMAKNEEIDFAVLDVRLGQHDIYPTAEILEKRNVPFLLLSGYGPAAAPPDKPWPTVGKPFTFEALSLAIAHLLQPARMREATEYRH